jgi:hypothetical protein
MKAAILFAALLTGTTFANIGSTEEECRSRYGDPLPDKLTVPGAQKAVAFKKNGLRITVGFFDGKAELMTYQKIREVTELLQPKLSEAEFAPLMEANGAGQKWEKKEVPGGLSYWARADGKVTGRYNRFQHEFEIYTTAFGERAAKENAARIKKQAEELNKK